MHPKCKVRIFFRAERRNKLRPKLPQAEPQNYDVCHVMAWFYGEEKADVAYGWEWIMYANAEKNVHFLREIG